ncbi:MAG: sigma-70 family RNA polymerase sigma factor [Bryobacteraceae bacterium]|jgi:RNA polymerase sigma-70 factor (ECF subfamily)
MEAVEAGITATAVHMDESALIRAAQSGDSRAFEELVRLYDQSVLRLAMNLLRSPEDANDIYQEAFLRVYKNLHNFRFDCSFHTWLYRIVTNLCLDALRKRKVRKEEGTVVETREGTLDRMDTIEEERADGNPQRRLLSRELQAKIRNVLADLTPRERMVFEMRHYEGMRLRAIGDVLGTSEEAAKNCLFRATQKMRAALGEFI